MSRTRKSAGPPILPKLQSSNMAGKPTFTKQSSIYVGDFPATFATFEGNQAQVRNKGPATSSTSTAMIAGPSGWAMAIIGAVSKACIRDAGRPASCKDVRNRSWPWFLGGLHPLHLISNSFLYSFEMF